MRHFRRYVAREVRIQSGIAVGQVWRSSRSAASDWAYDPDRQVRLFLCGTVFSSSSGRRMAAADLLSQYLCDGRFDPDECDGSFVVVIVDLPRDLLMIFNDRLGSLPVYWATARGAFWFAPEAKAIFAMRGETPRLSPAGAACFLSCGYSVGDLTLFEGVRALEPGTCASVRLSDPAIELRRWWKIVYCPRQELKSRKSAANALYREVLAAHRRLVPESSCCYDLLLSGGLDSRGILGCLARNGTLPRRAVSWGERSDIPDSDPYLAGALARRFGVRYEFFGYEPGQLLANAESWCRISELANDNIGWYAEGTPVLEEQYDPASEFVLLGDEAWGWGPKVICEDQARSAVMPARLPEVMRAVLKPEAARAFQSSYDSAVATVLNDCENPGWDDRKDFLYLHGRVARFIFSLGYYKELAVELRRPFLTRNVLEIIQGLPARFRWNKNLYRSMLSGYLPEVMEIPPATASSLPDWPGYARRDVRFRGFLTDLLEVERIEAGVLRGCLDPDALAARRKRYFRDGPVGCARSGGDRSRMPPMIPEWIRPYLRRWRRRDQAEYVGEFRCWFRLALLVLLEGSLDRFGRPGGRGTEDHLDS